MPRRAVQAAVGLAIVGGVAALTFALVNADGRTDARSVSFATSATPTESTTAAGTPARFAYLVAQHTNRCDLQGAMLGKQAGNTSLQGSCCTPMDATHYHAQVAALRPYRDVPEIPSDPYDIPAVLAKELLGYDHTIILTPAQQSVYDRAMQLSPEKGPCCCHCWRWDAFAGLSKYLITVHHMAAPELGRLIGILDGCGGPATAAQEARPGRRHAVEVG